MKKHHKVLRTISCTVLMFCVSLASFGGIVKTSASFSNGNGPVSKALDYLGSAQQPDGCISDFATSSWAIAAIAAAGEDPHCWRVDDGPSIIDYLIGNRHMLDSSKASDVSRFLLSVTAAGEDPRDIDGISYVEILKSQFVNGQIGTEEWLFDDFWAVLALISSGEAANSTIIRETVDFIKKHQNADGGWGWAVAAESDVDDTAAAMMTLVSCGEDDSTEVIENALRYLMDNQQPDGAFPSWGITNSASDSWAIGAICSAGQNPAEWQVNGTSVIEHLLGLQNVDGSFNWTATDPEWVNRALMTSYAIVALCLRQYPINGLHIYIRIEGDQATVWRRKVFVAASIIVDDKGQESYFTNPTVLGALDKAAEVGGFNYKVEQTAWGLYLYSVAGEEAAGAEGWMYRVNYFMPWVGADTFMWNITSPPNPPHEELLFYYGEWTDFPLKIIADKTEVAYGGNITATVVYFNDTTECWNPLEGVEVHFLQQTYITNHNGCVTITVRIDPLIWVEREAFIRSDRVEIKARTPDLNNDGKVDIIDIATAALAFGSHPGNPRWREEADLNLDGKVDIIDLALIAKSFGKTMGGA